MAANDMKEAAAAARADKQLQNVIEQQRREIEDLRRQLESRISGDVIVLEKHSNDLWKGTGVEYDEDGNVTKIRQREDTFVIRRNPNAGPLMTKEQALELALAEQLSKSNAAVGA